MGDDAVATIEESSEDTSSCISVQINEQQISVDEPEWQTVHPNNTHKQNKKRMTVKSRKELKALQRSEESAKAFAIAQSAIAEVATSFLRTMETESDELHDELMKETVHCGLDGVTTKGRSVEELITRWFEYEDKIKQDFDLLESIASGYEGSDLHDCIRQGKNVMNARAEGAFYQLTALGERCRRHRECEAQETERLRQERPKVSNKGVEVQG